MGANGALCTATWQAPTASVSNPCSCLVRVQTPSDCSKWVDCLTTATETKNPVGCPP